MNVNQEVHRLAIQYDNDHDVEEISTTTLVFKWLKSMFQLANQ